MDFTALTQYIDSLSRDMVPGIDVVVYQEHNPIYRHFAGMRDREAGIPMDGRELYWIFSATKVFTVTAALKLVEKGLMWLDDPVSDYLPAYGTLSVEENGRIRGAWKQMTLRHLFSMTGGLSYELDTPSIQKALLYSRGKADTLTLVNAFAEEPLLFDPGTHYRYSLCHDVLAAVIEVVSGKKYQDYLKTAVFEPLGITRTGFFGEDISEFAQQYIYDEATQTSRVLPGGNTNVYRLSENYASGGAGLYSCVDDYILLSDALACGGVGKSGAQILRPDTIDLMRTPQLTEELHKEFNAWVTHVSPRYSYGLGVRTLVDAAESASPKGEFGWDGAANAYTLIDPENRLSAFVGMHIRGFGYGYGTIHPAIRDLIYEGLKK